MWLLQVSRNHFSHLPLDQAQVKKKQHGPGVAVRSGTKNSIDEFKAIMCTGIPITQVHAAD